MNCVFCGHDPKGSHSAFDCCELGALAYDHMNRDESEFTMTVGELREIMRRLAGHRWEIARGERKARKVAGIARVRLARMQAAG